MGRGAVDLKRSVPAALTAAAVALLVAAGCSDEGGGDPGKGEELAPPTSVSRDDADAAGERMELTSPAFEEGAELPERFSCDGGNVSPPLRWDAIPERASQLAITVVDPDAPGGGFVHWIVTGLPAQSGSLPEGAPLPAGAMAAENDAGSVGWTGPCPPPGETHSYVFTLYALSEEPDLEGDPDADVAAVQGASSARIEMRASFSR